MPTQSANPAASPAPAPEAAFGAAKFRDPAVTAKGERRAVVALSRMRTLWFNTGSLCNITCAHCYMDSSPTNDRLAYLSAPDVAAFLDEAQAMDGGLEEVGFTGGEPFMNKHLPAMLADVLERGLRALVLSNAMKPMWLKRQALLDLRARHGERLVIRVSIDHHTPQRHEAERGAGSWRSMLKGLKWLSDNGFAVTAAGRTMWGETADQARDGYGALFAEHGIGVDVADPMALVLFPEMDGAHDVPEITVHCWDILGVAPESMMCASARMVVKRQGADAPVVVPCTLLPYDSAFELGATLQDAGRTVALNHPHCAKFCVLGGASCSA